MATESSKALTLTRAEATKALSITKLQAGGGDVMLFADGAGSGRFKGTLDNTLVFGKLKEALGL